MVRRISVAPSRARAYFMKMHQITRVASKSESKGGRRARTSIALAAAVRALLPSFFPLLALTIIIGALFWGPWLSALLALAGWVTVLRYA